MSPLRALRGCLRALPGLLALGMLALAALVATGHLRLAPVLTGSMRPAFPVGTLVAVVPVDGRALHVGDVIMFMPPKPYGTPTGGPVMHRLVAVTTGPDGRLQFRTKGDANEVKDPWVLDGSGAGFARLKASSVLAGRALLLARHSVQGPGLLLWAGVVLLVVALRRGRGTGGNVAAAIPPTAGRSRQRGYQPRHAA